MLCSMTGLAACSLLYVACIHVHTPCPCRTYYSVYGLSKWRGPHTGAVPALYRARRRRGARRRPGVSGQLCSLRLMSHQRRKYREQQQMPVGQRASAAQSSSFPSPIGHAMRRPRPTCEGGACSASSRRASRTYARVLLNFPCTYTVSKAV